MLEKPRKLLECKKPFRDPWILLSGKVCLLSSQHLPYMEICDWRRHPPALHLQNSAWAHPLLETSSNPYKWTQLPPCLFLSHTDPCIEIVSSLQTVSTQDRTRLLYLYIPKHSYFHFLLCASNREGSGGLGCQTCGYGSVSFKRFNNKRRGRWRLRKSSGSIFQGSLLVK